MANAERMPACSIAMTTYNGAAYVTEQLESFAKQSIAPKELVIVDDGSPDNTVDLCKDFASRVSFDVRIEQNSENLGYTRNFEKALQLCRGDIVFLADQDDVWYPNKLERMLREFDEYPDIDLLIHDLAFCDSNLNRIGQTKIERIESYGDATRRFVTGMATAARARFLKTCLPFPEDALDIITHDGWIHRCANLVHRKRVMNDVLADYRRHESNATASKAFNAAEFVNLNELRGKNRAARYSAVTTEKATRDLRYTRALRSWLTERYTDPHAHTKTADTLLRRADALERRVDLLARSRTRRVPSIVAMYIGGHYRYLNGAKSALKDLFFA